MLTNRQLTTLRHASADEKSFARILAIIEEIIQQPSPAVETRYESIFASLAEGVLVYSPAGQLIACNESARRLLRLPDDQTVEAALLFGQFSAWDETGNVLTEADDPLLRVLRRGVSVQDLIVRLAIDEAHEYWLQINAVPLLSGKGAGSVPTAVVISFRDITPRKTSEAALRVSEERFQLITRHLRQALHIRNMQTGALTYLSDNIIHLTGLSRAELMASPDLLAHYIHPDDIERVQNTYAEAYKTLTPLNVSYRILHPVNGVRWLRVNEYFTDGTSDHDLHMVGITEDITHEKETELTLARLNEELEQRVKERTTKLENLNKQLMALTIMRDQFIGNISHEIRTPLTNFNLYLRLLQARPENSERYFSVLTQETARLSKIVDNLLIISRLDRDKLIVQRETVAIDPVVQEAAEAWRAKYMAQNIEFVVSLSEAEQKLVVLGDKEMLGQVLDAMLSNSCLYTPLGGRVTLTVQDTAEWCQIVVEDNGLGFTPESEPHLFERFFRGEAPRIAQTAGTGLGLSIAFEIVKRHNGRIVPYSAGLHRGARFEVWLPLPGAHTAV